MISFRQIFRRLKNGQPLLINDRLRVEVKRAVHILLVENALLEDTAEFTIKAKNDSGEISETFNLIIQSKIFQLFILKKLLESSIIMSILKAPPTLVKGLEPTLGLKTGGDLILETVYNGFPVPNIAW